MKIAVWFNKEPKGIGAIVDLKSEEGDPKEEDVIGGLGYKCIDNQDLVVRVFPSTREAEEWACIMVNKIKSFIQSAKSELPAPWSEHI